MNNCNLDSISYMKDCEPFLYWVLKGNLHVIALSLVTVSIVIYIFYQLYKLIRDKGKALNENL